MSPTSTEIQIQTWFGAQISDFNATQLITQYIFSDSEVIFARQLDGAFYAATLMTEILVVPIQKPIRVININ